MTDGFARVWVVLVMLLLIDPARGQVPVECKDYSADMAATLNAALELAASSSGAVVYSGRCLIAGQDLVIPAGTWLRSNRYPGFQRQARDYDSLRGVIVLDAKRTIRLGDGSRLSDAFIMRLGMRVPTSMRTALTETAAFAGTAITISDATDASLDGLAILGFDRCIDIHRVSRARVRSAYGDCNNGLRIDQSHDISRIEDVHWWEALTTNQGWTVTRIPVTVAAADGGTARLMTAAPHGLISGDRVHLIGPSAIETAYATVTVTDETHLDVPNAGLAGLHRGQGGLVLIDTNRRPGHSFEVTNSESTELVNSFGYGFARGIHIGDGAGWTHLINVSEDGLFEAQEPTTAGITVDGTSYGTAVVGGVVTSKANAVTVDSTGGEAHSFTAMSLNPANGALIRVLAGRAIFTGDHAPTCCAIGIEVADGAGAVNFVGNDFPTAVLRFQSAVAQSRTTLVGNQLAAGQPALQMTSAAGGLTENANDRGGLGVANINVGGCPVLSGTGSPQNVVAAAPCAVWLQRDGGARATMWVKETGTGAAGWAAK